MFEAELKKIKDLVFAGRYKEAEVQFLNLKTATITENRIRWHQIALLKMRQGFYQDCLLLLQDTIKKYGGHISMWLDMASVYYLMGQMYNWQQTLAFAEKEFFENQQIITLDRKLDCLLIIGKFKEEEGSIIEAIQTYTENLKLCKQIHNAYYRIQYARTLSQVVRLKSQYDLKVDIVKFYQELLALKPSDTDWDCVFEVEHALLICEMKHFGEAQAWLRLERLVKNPLFHYRDGALIFSDAIYEFLMMKKKIPQFLIDGLEKQKNLNSYENTILGLARNKKFLSSDLNEWRNHMAPAPYLRCLLAAMGQAAPTDQNEIKKRIQFLIQDYSAVSKKAWQHFLNQRADGKINSLVYSRINQTLSYEGKIFNLRSKKFQSELVELLLSEPNLSCYVAIEKLWGGEGSETDFARLKMRVHRFNQEVSRAWGLAHFIRIKNSCLVFSENVIAA